MNTVIEDMIAAKTAQGLSSYSLAKRMNKDESTVKKQLYIRRDKDGKVIPCNMTLQVLDEYADVLGGRIIYISDDYEQKLEGEGLRKLQQQFADVGEENMRLKKRLDEKDRSIAGLRAGVEFRDQQIAIKDRALQMQREELTHREEDILGLNSLVRQQYEQIIDLQRQVMELTLATACPRCRKGGHHAE